MIRGVHHIAIICSEREAALRFYRDTLGFEVTTDVMRPERKDEILMLEGHGITLELFIDPTHPPRVTRPEAMGLRHLALRVDNVEEECGRLRAAGYEPEPIRKDSFNGRSMTFVKDPDGLPIELHE